MPWHMPWHAVAADFGIDCLACGTDSTRFSRDHCRGTFSGALRMEPVVTESSGNVRIVSLNNMTIVSWGQKPHMFSTNPYGKSFLHMENKNWGGSTPETEIILVITDAKTVFVYPNHGIIPRSLRSYWCVYHDLKIIF